ncbi:ABC transporter permease [Thomasclavelia cocleata]|jgi:oligopeptide transport system permease protein|uniref:Oligopeptide transport system permease protein n=1 Tax=Thomasclavelia cocleata TaxID=69824 RepID=A0A1I0H035_9FIRM|nr:ABC transporter permease [Thomasclavelia cocleata]MCI9131790.1 ABC transporter permease [Thomasclavelia cocleata]MCI9630552.1 ABC transporter permease [Thomasclavelia cocleata]MCR1961784.1 ABC transporter permease [Thomasclavelia cocleata]NDO43486.1 ABC transporter permease [Thomasclavelia cocleata]PJN80181.1 ABC transporter permease [Thomasclavelia cocleata]
MEENRIMDIELTPDMFEKLDDSKKNSEKISYESKTYLADAWGRFKANKLALIGLCFLALMAICSILIPMLSQYTYDGQDMANTFAAPSMDHFLGTDRFGRDVLVRIMYGGRISLSVGFSAATISLLVGVTYGAIAGYVGGKVDMVMMRIVDALYSIPDMLYLIMITVVMGSNFLSIIIGICISSWMGMARQVRAQVMTLKEQEFSLAAFVLGASKPRILLKHLIINSMGPIIVSFSMLVPSSIFYEATLGFLGIGLSAPKASWGTLANDARAMISSQPLQVVWPVLAICLTMLALNFIGDGLGDALDPKKK